mmetsp:Transcript_15528/g.21261  ORF Transcript_15528/g.21261 Transcript_15528/m.21261 type:complete len:448 (-) Transcript_15528:105-1448(-)|eukprot:CAMPEP_0201112656 /NCGR_PEP_ID=MMETSP0812-20130820/77382_1 /ASSEMBLY_ACC=CAM_ASM_000668 /TAXON_ID=98059 /ORGANISM="Dinobryon sp., Strain UTEXLB2267" /LENGTH=447 /DNA_ID=CAMNT_0047376045 /DNA_START=40 /DNA_END=1383 /DNA_ORIENTATION=+
MKAVIVGGGIAGRTTALFLSKLLTKKGSYIFSDIVLLEQQPFKDWKSTNHRTYVGLWTNALLALDSLNILRHLNGNLEMITESGYRTMNGNWLVRPTIQLNTIDIINRLPALGFTRSDILLAALDKGLEECPSVRVIYDMSPQEIIQEHGAITVRASSSLGPEALQLTAQVVVAADGMHSRVRHLIGHPESRTESRGYQVVRGFSLASRPLLASFQSWGPSARFAAVSAPVCEHSPTASTTPFGVTWFAAVASQPSLPGSEKRPFEGPFANLCKKGDASTLERLRALYSGWHPEVEQLLETADPASLSLCEATASSLPPYYETCSGVPYGPQAGLFFVGDARHTLDPILAQGAGLAVEDAQHLAHCLSSGDVNNMSQTLCHYHQHRAWRSARLYWLAELAQAVGQQPAGWISQVRDALLPRLPAALTGRLFDLVLRMTVDNGHNRTS